MGGLGRQAARKGRVRAVEMSPALEELHLADLWQRPPAEECAEERFDGVLLPGANVAQDRLILRLLRHQQSYALVEFSLVLMTFWMGGWCEVAEIDSCHDVDAHLHQRGRSTGERLGDPVPLVAIRSLDEVQSAYNVALDHIEDRWSDLKKRWHHG